MEGIKKKNSLATKKWISVSLAFVGSSLVLISIAGLLPSIGYVLCSRTGEEYWVGVFHTCSHFGNTTGVTSRFLTCQRFSGVTKVIPVWLHGSQLLYLCGCGSSLLTFILILGFLTADNNVAIAVAPGLGAACFGSAAFHLGGVLSFVSGLSDVKSLAVLIPRPCTIQRSLYSSSSYLMSSAILTLFLAGVVCALASDTHRPPDNKAKTASSGWSTTPKYRCRNAWGPMDTSITTDGRTPRSTPRLKFTRV